MRFRWTILAFAFSASTSVYADSRGRPAVATQHAQAGNTTGKPITTGKPTSGVTSVSTSATSGSKSAKSRSTSTSTSTKTSTTLNPIAAKISSKPQLNSKITALLPKNMTLNEASSGFKNQGQFIAALHVSHNLGCDCFKQLQTDMTTKSMSLGQAIQDVKKTANATVEARKAETETNNDVKGTTATATSTSTGKGNTKKTTHRSSVR